MKDFFKSHIPDSEHQIKRVWQDALIVFDANTILNLYRYSDNSRSEFVALLKNLRSRIWISEQAAREYFNNRCTVIGDQTKAYGTATKSIKDLRDALRKDRGHPFVAEETMNNLTSVLRNVENELEKNKEKQISRISSDDIMAEIAEVFDGRVGGRFSNDEFEEIFKEGADRYNEKVPPGYKDASKHENPTTFAEKRSVFGDLIIWKQIIAKAIELKKPVIFVTDDAKEDWWLETQGKTIGPRIELLDEFYEQVNQKFYMFRPDQFLKHAKVQLQSVVSPETIKEIRETDESRVSRKEKTEWIEKNTQSMLGKSFRKILDVAMNSKSPAARFDENGSNNRIHPSVIRELNNMFRVDSQAFFNRREEVAARIEKIRNERTSLDNFIYSILNDSDVDEKDIEPLIKDRQDIEARLENEVRILHDLNKIIQLGEFSDAARTLTDEE